MEGEAATSNNQSYSPYVSLNSIKSFDGIDEQIAKLHVKPPRTLSAAAPESSALDTVSIRAS